MIPEDPTKFTYDLTHCYLEVARGAMTTVHHPSGSLDEVFTAHGHSPLANAILALASVSVIYSFLSIESFINYQLFRLWERRHDGTGETARFLQELGDVAVFQSLKSHAKARELTERLKTLCRVLGYRQPHEAIPDTWRRLNELVATSRHFLVHPYPDPGYFNSNMQRIMDETKAGEYVRVVEETLGHLYSQSRKVPPRWLTKSTLLRFRGVDLLVGRDEPSNPGMHPTTQKAGGG